MIEKVDDSLYPRLLEIWESAVLATHDFLKQEDFEYYKSRIIPFYLPNLILYSFFNKKREILGFIGTFGEKLEMLFVDNSFRGKGIGTQLLEFAINHLHVVKVDVNEQNLQALNFYKKHGFIEYSRSDIDGEGKSYPVINMILH